MNAKHREDLDWLAFRYVAAELSPAESREFQRRLEEDQEAREAVGRIVEVTCAVRSLDWDAAPRVARVRRSRPWYQDRRVQMIAGLALGLALAVLVWDLPRGKDAGKRDGGMATLPPAAELAVVWSSARAELNTRPDEETANWKWLAPADRESDLSIPALGEAVADTPDWMVSAVVAMESEGEDQDAPASNVEGI